MPETVSEALSVCLSTIENFRGDHVSNISHLDNGHFISVISVLNIYVEEKDGTDERTQFSFYLDSPDMMEVYCWKDGSTYTLLRS